ncbi:MAG: 50S ribosomal protein L17 [Anaerolineales bacterium]
MRHRVAGKKLNRSSSHRTALRRNLIKELFRHGQIRTTRAKAEAVQGQSEKMITIAKRGIASGDPVKELNARRRVASQLNDPEVVQKLFDELAPRYMDRPGGYTRRLRLGWRKGDAAELVLLALVKEEL